MSTIIDLITPAQYDILRETAREAIAARAAGARGTADDGDDDDEQDDGGPAWDAT